MRFVSKIWIQFNDTIPPNIDLYFQVDYRFAILPPPPPSPDYIEPHEREIYWRASERASETLTGVTQLKIGGVCLSVCMDIRMSFCTLTLAYFCVRSAFDPVPTSLNSILWFSDH